MSLLPKEGSYPSNDPLDTYLRMKRNSDGGGLLGHVGEVELDVVVLDDTHVSLRHLLKNTLVVGPELVPLHGNHTLGETLGMTVGTGNVPERE